jgi:hypothetical protein
LHNTYHSNQRSHFCRDECFNILDRFAPCTSFQLRLCTSHFTETTEGTFRYQFNNKYQANDVWTILTSSSRTIYGSIAGCKTRHVVDGLQLKLGAILTPTLLVILIQTPLRDISAFGIFATWPLPVFIIAQKSLLIG